MRRTTLLLLTAALVSAVAGPGRAQMPECPRLWVERNSIYKMHGYCFKTSRAISYFGNAGCQYDNQEDVPLSRAERARVARLQAQERALGCPN